MVGIWFGRYFSHCYRFIDCKLPGNQSSYFQSGKKLKDRIKIIDMIKNYFKIAWRTLYDKKLYSTLNIVGLTFGMACFFLIGLYLIDELTFDRQHAKADQIYRIVEHRQINNE